LRRLCDSSGCGARIWESRLPLPQLHTRRNSSSESSRESSLNPVELALHGGEDYELIFTVARNQASRVPRALAGVTLHDVGEILPSRGLRLVLRDGTEVKLAALGYDHFRSVK
jgi:thiamine-monophosphate kinase